MPRKQEFPIILLADGGNLVRARAIGKENREVNFRVAVEFS
ncbi:MULTISPECIES: hypothetical protein [unclassified Microcoleus]|jgi:hypothetical protein|nr:MULTISPECIES: hypothetical protein [unclassified Microcoleus]